MEPIVYDNVEDPAELDVQELAEFYSAQGHRAPSDSEKLRSMVQNSFCVVTARQYGRLIGFARGLTDGVIGQLAECKLDAGFQGPAAVTRKDGRVEHDQSGIAMEMARRVLNAFRDRGVEQVHVLAYGTEVDFCEELGFKPVGGMVALQLDLTADVPAATMTS